MQQPTHPSDGKILIVEDSQSIALTYKQYLTSLVTCDIARTAQQAIDLITKGKYSTVVLDLQLPDMDGLEIIQHTNTHKISLNYIVITSNGSLNTAVQAMRLGAYDFLVKPVSKTRLITSINNAQKLGQLQNTVKTLTQEGEPADSNHFIGQSEPMLATYRMIKNMAQSNAPAFITGETGTGKEICARELHNHSHRRQHAFMALNCAAIPDTLIESEIFGHVKGAFTGASENRDGAVRCAQNGTLFLDEICEMDLNLQVKLLRFLQTSEIKKVGSDKIETVNVRIICATNLDPVREMEKKTFREDLFYRLNVLTIHMPPLRERGKDIIILAEHFMHLYADEETKEFTHLCTDAKALLLAYHWPGNIRELQNLIRRLIITQSGPALTASMFAPFLQNARLSEKLSTSPIISNTYALDKSNLNLNIYQPMDKIEQDIIKALINSCDGSLPKAAKILQLSPSTLYRKRENWQNDKILQTKNIHNIAS